MLLMHAYCILYNVHIRIACDAGKFCQETNKQGLSWDLAIAIGSTKGSGESKDEVDSA